MRFLASRSVLTLAIHATLAFTVGEALADAPPASASATLEEVTVTAQRRTENLQDVPLAVTSLSARSLDQRQIVNTLDVARAVPNFIASNNVGQASANVYYIRGLGQTQSFPTFEPQVGTYVDDIYLGRQNANNFALFGVDQLQVLRGPQGTLFGRNSTGGAVVVSLEKPADKAGAFLEAGAGSFGHFLGRVSIDLPLSETLKTRLSVFSLTDDGYVTDVTTHEKMNQAKDWGVREAIDFKPSDKVDWSLSFDFADNNHANILNQPGDGSTITGSNRISLSGFGLTPGALRNSVNGGLTGGKGGLGQGVDVKSYGAMSNIRLSFDAGTLNLISGYRGLKQLTAVDFPFTGLGPAVPFDQGPTGQFTLAQELKNKQYSQEVKWSGDAGARIKYTVGAFYLYETNKNDFGAILNFGPLFGTAFLPFTFGDMISTNDTRSSALYAQGDIKLSDPLTLTVGGRFTHEQKTLTVVPNTESGFTTADIAAAGWLTKLTVNEFTPRIALEYKATPDVMVYGSITRGFQGGGWNGLAFSAADFNSFNPEKVTSYETGVRTESSDHRVRLNANVFYEDVKDYQLLSDNAATGQFDTSNAADLEAYGLEAELAWRPIDRLTIELNAGLMHAKYKNPSALVQAQQASCVADGVACGSGIVDPNGNLATPSNTPHANAALHTSYDWALGGYVVTPSVSVRWIGEQNVGTEGKAEGLNPALTTLDAGVSVHAADSLLTVTAECSNCTKKDWGTAYLFGYKYYNVPGTWGARINYKF